jgi:Gluconate 2-dehydrogenase subunit 3
VIDAAAPTSPGRRRLLKRGLVGGALLVLCGLAPLALRSTLVRSKPRRALRLLSEDEHAILTAVAARFAPGDGAGPTWPTSDALDCAGKIDALLATTHPEVGAEFRRLLRLFESAVFGLAFTGTPTPFTRLDAAAQDARLEAWRRSRLALLRSGYQAMKRLSHAVYYSSPEVYALVGYPGPPEVPRGPA